jgi:hypothetical protein
MHQQIKASPDTIAENIRTVIDALAGAGVSFESISPDFEPPHVRVLVEHEFFDDAFNALAGLGATIVRSVEPVRLPDRAGALKTAMDALEAEGHTVESILVLRRGSDTAVSFGVAGDVNGDWADEAASLMERIQKAVDNPQ